VATEAELLAAIAATAAAEIGSTVLSDQARLVYADWLMSRGDRRGELIVLDHKERTTPGGLTHPDHVAALLRLAAEFGFPHLPDPDAHILPWQQLGRDHDYRVEHDGHTYTLVRRATLLLAIDTKPPLENITLTLQERWTDEQVNVIMSMVSRAIRRGSEFTKLVFPEADEMRRMPEHRLGPLPMYYSAEIIEDFEADWMLRARDHARWYRIYDRMMAGYSPTSHRR
jgi:uncharacterized protein (TIGR02996 family)